MSKPSKGKAAGKGKAAAPARTAEESMLLAGLTAFHTHHQATYKARWLKSLYPALLLQHPSVAVLNQHMGARQLAQVRQQLAERGAKPWHRGNPGEVECWRFEDEAAATDAAAAQLADLSLSKPASTSPAANTADLDPDEQPIATRFLPPTPLDPNVSNLLPYYLLDGASVLAVDAMTVGPHHSILDLCAAPGGKSIVAAQALDLLDLNLPAAIPASSSTTLALTQPLATLHSNEPQANRRIRLQNVLSEYLPPTVRKNRTRVEVTGWDATKIALPAGRYDRVLVDAPCSSDRHVLSNSKELASWSTKRIHSNADRQELLLANALKSVKVGGIVVYATCSLSKQENDQVISNVLEKLNKSKRNASSASTQRVNVQVLKIRLTGSQQPSAAAKNDGLDASASSPSASASSAASVPAPASALASDEDDVLYLPLGEPTKFGWMVLPDQVQTSVSVAVAVQPGNDVSAAASATATSSSSAPAAVASPTPASAIGHGFGPLYFSRLKRISNAAAGESEDDEEDDSEEEDEEDEEAGDESDQNTEEHVSPSNPKDDE